MLHLNDLEMLQVSCIAESSLSCLVWCIAAWQDTKYSGVDERLCMLMAALFVGFAVLFHSWVVVCLVLVLSAATFMKDRLKHFGPADFLIFAHFMLAIDLYSINMFLFVGYTALVLACFVLYTWLYRDETGAKWHRGMMVPAIPPYALAVILFSAVRFQVCQYLFFH